MRPECFVLGAASLHGEVRGLVQVERLRGSNNIPGELLGSRRHCSRRSYASTSGTARG